MSISTILITFLNILLMTLIITPLLLTIIIPLSIYRLFISVLSKLIRPDLIKIARPRDSIFANDNMTLTPSSTVLVAALIHTDLDIVTLRNHTSQTLSAFDPTTNKPKYPPYRQYFEKWCGFVFLKEEDFDINVHVKEWKKPGSDNDIDASVITEEDYYHCRRQLIDDPYKPKTSAWEVILIRNFEDSKSKQKGSIIITKFHHGLADGFSFMKVWLKANLNSKNCAEHIPQSITKPLTFTQNVGTFALTFVQAPSTAISQAPKVDPRNIFHPDNTQLKGKRHPLSASFSMSTVKDIAKQSGTSYTAVIMEGMAGGIRNYLVSRKLDLPKSIDITIPLPWPGHMDKIQNHFTFAVLEIPIAASSPLQRLRELYDKLSKLKRSTVPSFNYVSSYLAGILPNALMSKVLKAAPSSILFSSLPGPLVQVEMLGKPILSTAFEGGYGKGALGMGVSFTSYNGKVGISINPDEGIVPTKEDAEYLLQCMLNEFQLLSNISNV